MSNNINLPNGVDPKPFLKEISEHLSLNLDHELSRSLSSLLAIDYAIRLKSEPDLFEYINLCISRLQKHLGMEVVLDNDFSTTMSLFTVAITPEQEGDEDKSKTQKQSLDAFIESSITEMFGEISTSERNNIRAIMQKLLNGSRGKEMMNLIKSNPLQFKDIVNRSVETQKTPEAITGFACEHMQNILEQSSKIENKKSGIKNILGKIAFAGGVFAAASMGLAFGGLALPALLVPATVAAVKYAPTAGNKIGSAVVENSGIIATAQKELNNIIDGIFYHEAKKFETPEKSAEQSLSKEEIKTIAQSLDIEKEKIASREQAQTEKISEQKKNKTQERGL